METRTVEFGFAFVEVERLSRTRFRATVIPKDMDGEEEYSLEDVEGESNYERLASRAYRMWEIVRI